MINLDDRINIDFNVIDIGKVYLRNYKECIFDPIREMLVLKTPEEIIRQKIVKYLIEYLSVPKYKIGVEVPLTILSKGATGRADIIVYGEENGVNVPVILVECKAPNVSLIDDVWYQALNYVEKVGADLIILSNGNETYGLAYNRAEESLNILIEIPKYEDLMIKGNYKYIPLGEPIAWKRPDFNHLTSKETIENFLSYGWIGEDTQEALYPLIINLAGLLQDSREKFSPMRAKGIDIIEDDIRYTSYGNVAGGSWEGLYRYFILEDGDNSNQIVSMSIFGSMKVTNDPVFGNRRGSTVLIVAIDDFDKSHNSLQLNLDKFTIIDDSNFTIWHDGTLTVGKSGAAKRNEVIDYIKRNAPELVNSQGRIVLGTFDCSKEIIFEQLATKSFIINTIKYALLRDDFRKMKQC